jgi:hypothetical protein
VKLNPAAVSAAAKKIRCPKCQAVFRVPGTEPVPDEDPYVDDDPYVDEDPYVDAPRSSSRRRGRRRKRGARSIDLKKPLKVLAVLALIGGVGVGASLLVKKQFGGLSGLSEDLGITGGIDYTYMPAGTHSITFLRPRANWNAEIVRQFRDAAWADAQLAQFQNQTGFAYTDVESVTLFEFDRGGLEVVKLATGIDPEAVTSRKPGIQPVQHGSATYYLLPDSPARSALYFPDSKTTLVAPETVITSIIDGTFVAGDAAAFNFVDGSSHRLTVNLQVDHDWLWSSLNDHPLHNRLGGWSSDFESAHGSGIVSLANGVRFRGDVQFRQSLKFASDEAAEQARAWLAEHLTKAREAAENLLKPFESRLEAAQQAERERQERADQGENPFGNPFAARVATVEDEQRAALAKVEILRGSEVTRSGSLLTLVSIVSADYFSANEGLRQLIIQDYYLAGVTAQSTAPVAFSEQAGSFPVPAMQGAAGPTAGNASTTGAPARNQRRVVELTHNIQSYTSKDIADLDQKVEEALLWVGGYVAGSAIVDVGQARISYQLLGEVQDIDAIRQLRTIGLVLDFRVAKREELLREVPERSLPTIELELELLDTRLQPAHRVEIVEASLGGVPGYIRGSLVVDQEARRVTARFTSQPDIRVVMLLLNGPGGLSVRRLGDAARQSTEADAAAQSAILFVSVYYESYSATDPVGEAARRVAEATPGYIAGTLDVDEGAQFFTFQIQSGRPDGFEFGKRLGAAGFGGPVFSTGPKPSTAESLKDYGSRRSGRTSADNNR